MFKIFIDDDDDRWQVGRQAAKPAQTAENYYGGEEEKKTEKICFIVQCQTIDFEKKKIEKNR